MSDERIFFICDPERNKECAKDGYYRAWGPCKATSRAEYAKRDADGKPIEAFRVEGNRVRKSHGTD